MKIALLPCYFTRDYTYDVFPMMQRVAKCGFKAIQLSVNEDLLSRGKPYWQQIRNCAADHDLTVTFGGGLSVKNDISSEDAEIRRNGVRYLSKCMEAIAAIGGRGLDGIHYQAWNDFDGKINKLLRWKNSVESAREIMKACNDYDVDFAVEVANRHEVFMINTAADGVRYCEEIGDAHAKVQLDTYHMNIEEDNFYDPIILAGKRLYNLHVCENNRKVARGRGYLPWSDVRRALLDIQYNGFVTMEPFCLTGGEIEYGSRIWRVLAEDTSDAGLERDVMEGRHWLEEYLLQGLLDKNS